MSSYYNPRAYVPGGSTRRVASVIQAMGRRKPIIRTTPAIPPIQTAPRFGAEGPRPGVIAARPVDPFIGRANTLVEQMFSPLLTRLGAQRAAAEANARAAYGVHATALENALKASSAPIPTAFDTAIGQSAKVNEAVANRLQGQGQTAGSTLATQLAQISADPGAAAELSKFYTNAGNAEFAHGAADLQHLIGRRGEAVAYQDKLPGIGRLEANRGLQQALSEMNSEFGNRASDLETSAVSKAFDLYGDLKSESAAEKARKAQEKQNLIEVAQRERASLRALAAAAMTAKEKAMYLAKEKELDRKLRWDIASLNADTRIKTDNPPAAPKPPSVTGPANQKFITVNGKKVKNPNYVPPSQSGEEGDTWKTPGSAKRQRVITSVRTAIVNPETGRIRDVFTKSGTPDKTISNKIWTTMRLLGISPTSPEGKKLWRDIFLSLEGVPSSLGPYELPQFVRGK